MDAIEEARMGSDILEDAEVYQTLHSQNVYPHTLTIQKFFNTSRNAIDTRIFCLLEVPYQSGACVRLCIVGFPVWTFGFMLPDGRAVLGQLCKLWSQRANLEFV